MPILLILVALCALTAHADVTRKQKVTSQSFGAYEGTTTYYYTADRSAEESEKRWTAGVMKTMTGGKPTESASITRLDKEIIWQIDPRKKSYTEMTFAEFREMIMKAQQEMAAEGGEEVDTSTVSEDLYDWTWETKSDPNPRTINGFVCHNAQFVATGINKQNPEDKVWIRFDCWNSPDIPGSEEIRAFQMRYLQALKLDEKALTPGLMSAAMFYQKQMDKLIEEMKKAPGESVLQTMEIKRRQLVGPAVGQAVGEAAKEELLGKLPFGKKKEKKQEEPRWEEKVKFSFTSELLEASLNPVDPGKFEVPAGFKLKEGKK